MIFTITTDDGAGILLNAPLGRYDQWLRCEDRAELQEARDKLHGLLPEGALE